MLAIKFAQRRPLPIIFVWVAMNPRITKILSKYLRVIKEEGVVHAGRMAASRAAAKLGFGVQQAVIKRRIQLGQQLDALFNSTVQYGPFKGLKLSQRTWWSPADRGTMLLGLYEKEVLGALSERATRYCNFIDLGAADGYYGVGVLTAGLFSNSICYEMSEAGRKTIEENARLNGVFDKIEIRGMASAGFYKDLPPDVLSSSIILIDIEGAEFELMNEDTFHAFRSADIFIELHEGRFADGAEKLAKLKQASTATHIAYELKMGARDLSVFPELAGYTDDDRWLLCSEGRATSMTWLRFEPRTRP